MPRCSVVGKATCSSASTARVVRVHRLVGEVASKDLTKGNLASRQKALGDVVFARNAVLLQTKHWESDRWELQPLEALAWLWDEKKCLFLADWLFKHVGMFSYRLADWNRSERVMRRAIQIIEQSYPRNHPEVALALSNLAQLLKATDRFEEAEKLMRRALEINEQSYMANQLDIARDLTHLAVLLMNTGRITDSEPLLKRAVSIFDSKRSSASVEYALALNGLARFLQRSRRNEEAEPLFRRALALWEQTVGENSPEYATSLMNLAVLLKDTKRPKEAETNMFRALKIDEDYYGPNHHSVARDLNNIATFLEFTTRRSAEAEKFFRRSVEIHVNNYRDTGRARPEMKVIIKNYRRYLFHTLNLNDEVVCAKLAIVPSEFLE